MFLSLIADLRQDNTWDPAKLLAASFRWPSSYPLIQLRDITTSISPEALVTVGSEVITPASLDPIRASIRRRSRRYQGAVYLVGGSLQPGDLVVASSPGSPVILINEHLRGAAVAAKFVALRPLPGVSPFWLWGVLNSESGQRIRRAMATGGAISRLNRADIEALEVPLPPVGKQQALKPHLMELEATTATAEEEEPATWWRTTDLRGTDWRFESTSRNPELLNSGVPLADLCREIVRGSVLLKTASADAQTGDIPVTDIAVLGGNPPKLWISAHDARLTVAMPGDVLIPVIGERAHALIAPEVTAVHRNVFVLRLHDPSLGPALIQFLKSTEGFRLRQMLLVSSSIPHMRQRDLACMPIPPGVLSSPKYETPSEEPLANRLERALWSC